MFEAIRFLWYATRGHRLAPWRSDYVKWRIETFSGQKAETIRASDVWRFAWMTRGELLQFLLWTGKIEKLARERSKQR